jgi:hypothetical protein
MKTKNRKIQFKYIIRLKTISLNSLLGKTIWKTIWRTLGEPSAAMLEIFNIMKFTCDRINSKKWPHTRALRPPDGAQTGLLTSSKARLLLHNDASFNFFTSLLKV